MLLDGGAHQRLKRGAVRLDAVWKPIAVRMRRTATTDASALPYAPARKRSNLTGKDKPGTGAKWRDT
jgi:hypothetical protein